MVMKSLLTIQNETTIILIAHRLTTVESCDNIYMFDNGNIVESDTYDRLIEKSEKFRAMAISSTKS